MTTTATHARKAANEATRTVKSAKTQATRTARKASDANEHTARRLQSQTRRIAATAQAEVKAVAATPHRPLLFALGVVDRTVAAVKATPSAVLTAPSRARDGLVSVSTSAADLFVGAQRSYDEVADDGAQLVKAIRRQESTERAVRFAERAQRRGQLAVQDTEKAVSQVAQAAAEAAAKIG